MASREQATNNAINSCQSLSRGQTCQVTIANPDFIGGAKTSVERNVGAEHSALINGVAADQRTNVFGFCTDGKDEQAARNCAVNNFISKGGNRQTKSWAWTCKGWYALAQSPSGAMGFKGCALNRQQAVNEATANCQQYSAGQACYVTVAAPDRQ
jgi:hypothetical protein